MRSTIGIDRLHAGSRRSGSPPGSRLAGSALTRAPPLGYQPQKIKASRLRRIVRGALAALLLAPILGEAGLRLTGEAFRYPSPCALVDDRGCLLLPHLHETIVVAGDAFTFSTDARGLRNREATPDDASRRRVVVLGDSAAFGAHVDDGEVFAALLDARLAARGIAVINTGSGFLESTDQQLRYLVDEGDRLAPALVILLFNASNDVSDNSREEFYRDGAPQAWRPRLLQRAVAVSAGLPGYALFTDHSWLFGAFSFFFLNSHVRFGKPPNARRNQATESVLAGLESECRRRGAELLVVLLPHRESIPERLRAGRYAERSPEQLVVDTATRLDLHFVDGADVTSGPGAITGDGHLSPAGHRALADALEPRLTSSLGPRP